MNTWFVLDDSSDSPKPTGPYTREQLEAMVRVGAMRPNTLVAMGGASAWVMASSDPMLAGLFQQSPPISVDGVLPSPTSSTTGSALGQYSAPHALSLAWRSLWNRWPSWIALSLTWLGLCIVVGAPQWIAQIFVRVTARGSDEEARRIANSVMGVVSCFDVLLQIFVGLPLAAGMVYAAAEILAGRGQLGDLFQGFRRYGAAVLAGMLFIAIYIAVALLALIPLFLVMGVHALTQGGPMGPSATVILAMVITMLLFLCGFAVVVLRVVHAPTIVVDPMFGRRSVMDAFALSWRNSEGCGLSMLLLLIVTSVLAALSLLLFCVGILVVGVPLQVAVFGAMYALIQRNRLLVAPAS